MNKENTKYLIENYPKLYLGVNKPVSQSLMSFGFECGDGWFDLINNMSFLISSHDKHIRKTNIKNYLHNRKLRVIKTEEDKIKFLSQYDCNAPDYIETTFNRRKQWSQRETRNGYIAPTDEELMLEIKQDIEFKNAQLLTPKPVEKFKCTEATQVKEKFGTLSFYTNFEDEFVSGVIRMGEAMSGCICDTCGNKAQLSTEGWWRTMCENCKEKR